MKKPELLAPAGDLEKLKIAVLYGADAVFVGSKEFSLRSRASNFTIADLELGAEFCHAHGAKLYVTTNIVPHNSDLIGLIDYLQDLQNAGVDAIICSSYAVMYIAKRYTNLEVHISTQQSLANSLAVKFYEEYGASRVVLARELSIKEIEEIKRNTNLELEVFIHGGMCSSYSGRCMLSNHMTNRDANRGGCAHSCRWNYDLYMGDELISDNDRFQFSSKDLMAVNQLPRLLECADSLKIEGRMKSIHYIATVTKVYRMIIDEYFETGTVKDLEYYKKEINQMDDESFELFLKYHLATCEREELLGAGRHILDILCL
jgi:putative protease